MSAHTPNPAHARADVNVSDECIDLHLLHRYRGDPLLESAVNTLNTAIRTIHAQHTNTAIHNNGHTSNTPHTRKLINKLPPSSSSDPSIAPVSPPPPAAAAAEKLKKPRRKPRSAKKSAALSAHHGTDQHTHNTLNAHNNAPPITPHTPNDKAARNSSSIPAHTPPPHSRSNALRHSTPHTINGLLHKQSAHASKPADAVHAPDTPSDEPSDDNGGRTAQETSKGASSTGSASGSGSGDASDSDVCSSSSSSSSDSESSAVVVSRTPIDFAHFRSSILNRSSHNSSAVKAGGAAHATPAAKNAALLIELNKNTALSAKHHRANNGDHSTAHSSTHAAAEPWSESMKSSFSTPKHSSHTHQHAKPVRQYNLMKSLSEDHHQAHPSHQANNSASPAPVPSSECAEEDDSGLADLAFDMVSSSKPSACPPPKPLFSANKRKAETLAHSNQANAAPALEQAQNKKKGKF